MSRWENLHLARNAIPKKSGGRVAQSGGRPATLVFLPLRRVEATGSHAAAPVDFYG